ncbi:hypothetical protein VNO77_39798 [Canavalia gladiata]|uniref:Uncharacterized protein n=1 Tax=Canavalia gladiata TaxID=3824 RepID=A0AAN9JX76_CANGL
MGKRKRMNESINAKQETHEGGYVCNDRENGGGLTQLILGFWVFSHQSHLISQYLIKGVMKLMCVGVGVGLMCVHQWMLPLTWNGMEFKHFSLPLLAKHKKVGKDRETVPWRFKAYHEEARMNFHRKLLKDQWKEYREYGVLW